MCPNRTPRQLTTRRQKVAITNMLGNTAMTGNPRGPALGQVTASRGALASTGTQLVKQGTPLIKCMREAHAAGRPAAASGGTITARRRTFPAGILWDRNGLLRGHFYPTSSIAGPAARRSACRRSRSERSRRHAARNAARGHAARNAARGHTARNGARGTVRSGHAALSDQG